MERKLRVNCGIRNSSAFFHYSSSINEPVALGINMHMYSIVLGRLIRSRDRINNHAALCAGWPLITDLLTSCTRPRVNYSSSSVAHPKNSSPGPKTSSRGGLMNTVEPLVSFTIIGNGESTCVVLSTVKQSSYSNRFFRIS